MGEVAAGGAVAVPVGVSLKMAGGGVEGCGGLPEVVVKVVGAGFVGLVGEYYTGPAMIVLSGRVLDEAFLCWAMRHAGMMAWGCVAI